ncbi:hypothetical protein [Flammeovirga sp. SJP92]|uniref:hypothetical protein n=1 Tax=Flammeovirga sp. SJP92 TaxID=1775430 RepID=UPI00079B5230|nr:hypothetical protein [Flammeovirga sp. SJP92]KXX71068.1 hypothetical protein AVL50_10730 [Flammeovirga sp. SJP92]
MKYFQFLILMLLSFNSHAQRVTYNLILDSADQDTKEVMNLIENYLKSNPENKRKIPIGMK